MFSSEASKLWLSDQNAQNIELVSAQILVTVQCALGYGRKGGLIVLREALPERL